MSDLDMILELVSEEGDYLLKASFLSLPLTVMWENAFSSPRCPYYCNMILEIL
jgi:hypothetical protein